MFCEPGSPCALLGSQSPLSICIGRVRCCDVMTRLRRIACARSTLRKAHPLSLRLLDADRAIIDRATSMRGRSRTEFMQDAALRTAEEEIMENTLIPWRRRALPPSSPLTTSDAASRY
ncbi:DUF1778 domain-containing protein [Novosphingobium sp.]|uniref:type II toxin-antitoxin system TacA family antitoxin n=1 Tax=Novosphingobium sp. TaxID=1874826 RepID=UPI00342E7E3B